MPLPPLTQLQAVVLQPDGNESSIRVFGEVLLEAEGLHLSLLFPMQLALCPVWIFHPVWERGEEGLGCFYQER
jgi:hypothetical protein